MKDGSRVEQVLQKAEEKIRDVPGVGNALSKSPLMLSVIRGYSTKEHTEVSPKVIITMLCALIYLLSGKDFIPDSKPVVGMVDDAAVIVTAFTMVNPELEAYDKRREEKGKPESKFHSKKAPPPGGAFFVGAGSP